MSAIQDLYNNEIISYAISKRNSLELVLNTLAHLPETHNAIRHSDQGFQYTNPIYRDTLAQMKIAGSHSRRGNCLDNACIESFFSHLKTELQINKRPIKEENIIEVISGYVNFYNNDRFQKKLSQLSPVEFRRKLAV